MWQKKDKPILIHRFVRGLVIDILWEGYKAINILENEDEIEKITNTIIRKININKYGIDKLLEDKDMFKQLVKDNLVLLMKYSYKIKPVIDMSNKLYNCNYDRFYKIGLKDLSKNCKIEK